MATSSSLRVGLIGAGRVATQHLEAMLTVDGLVPVAVADPRGDAASTLGRAYGIQAFTNYHDLLNAQIDAVDIVVPHDLHHQIARDALVSGRHVVMDKPLATTVADGRDLVTVARSAGRVLCIVHNLLFHPAVERAREMIDTGVIGQPTTAHAWSRGWLDLTPWDFRLDAVRTGGGAWTDNGPHLLYVLQSLLGPIDCCQVVANQLESRIGAEDSLSAVVTFTHGSTASIRISYAEPIEVKGTSWPDGWSQGVDVAGRNGWIRLEVTPRGLVEWRTGTSPTVREDLDIPFSASFAGVLDDFSTAVRTGAPLRVEPEAACSLLELTLDSDPGYRARRPSEDVQ